MMCCEQSMEVPIDALESIHDYLVFFNVAGAKVQHQVEHKEDHYGPSRHPRRHMSSSIRTLIDR
eukprot:1558616-Amphidinium_carterae.2